jgi:hypothetical protein
MSPREIVERAAFEVEMQEIFDSAKRSSANSASEFNPNIDLFEIA